MVYMETWHRTIDLCSTITFMVDGYHIYNSRISTNNTEQRRAQSRFKSLYETFSFLRRATKKVSLDSCGETK